MLLWREARVSLGILVCLVNCRLIFCFIMLLEHYEERDREFVVASSLMEDYNTALSIPTFGRITWTAFPGVKRKREKSCEKQFGGYSLARKKSDDRTTDSENVPSGWVCYKGEAGRSLQPSLLNSAKR